MQLRCCIYPLAIGGHKNLRIQHWKSPKNPSSPATGYTENLNLKLSWGMAWLLSFCLKPHKATTFHESVHKLLCFLFIFLCCIYILQQAPSGSTGLSFSEFFSQQPDKGGLIGKEQVAQDLTTSYTAQWGPEPWSPKSKWPIFSTAAHKLSLLKKKKTSMLPLTFSPKGVWSVIKPSAGTKSFG